MTSKIELIQSMLTMIHGEGLENFQAQSAARQDRYLSACADMAAEALELAVPLWEHVKGWRASNLDGVGQPAGE